MREPCVKGDLLDKSHATRQYIDEMRVLLTRTYRTILLFLIPFALLSNAEAREWNAVRGLVFEAKFVSADDETLTLFTKEFNETYTLSLTALSQGDREFVADLVEDTRKKQAEDPEEQKKMELVLRKIEIANRGKESTGTEKIPDNFDSPWPGIIAGDINVEVIATDQDQEAKRFTYQSPNYEFISDVSLTNSLVSKFAVLFEATREYCRALPLSLKKAHLDGREHRYQVFLFESFDTYVRNGGPPSSAGVYLSGRDIILVPLTSLGVRKSGSSYRFDWDGSNKTLPHELVHQLTEPIYYEAGSRGWFTEGLAEYVAVTPYRSAKFNNKLVRNAVKDYVVEYGRDGRGGRALGKEITVPALEDFMLQSYQSFTANGNQNYGIGLLITYYFLHSDLDGNRVAVTAFLKGLRQGKSGSDALDELRQGRSFEELEEAIADSWRSRGIKITFQPSTTK